MTSVVDLLEPQGNSGGLSTPSNVNAVTGLSDLSAETWGELQTAAYDVEHLSDKAIASQPAKPVLKANKLTKTFFVLPGSPAGSAARLFVDRKLPPPGVKVNPNLRFN